jgi:hypothetical protein
VGLLSVPDAALAQTDSLLCITGQITTETQGVQPYPPPVATCFSCDTTTTGDCDDYRSDPDAWDLDEEGPLYRIPVVFHVLMDSTGIGDISDSLIAVQMDMLNEGFMSSVGSFSQGIPTRIMFKLSRSKPEPQQPSTSRTAGPRGS